MKKIFTLLLLLSSLSLFSQTIYYVKTTGSDASNGTSWATAFKTLQKALTTISSGQIWVAAGTYYPDEGPGLTDNDRTAAFHLKSGVGIYGGFVGTETDLSQRVWEANKTILSGEIQRDGDSSNNTSGVVQGNSVNPTAILDGVTITGGYTTGNGGGLYNTNASPTIANCTITGNMAATGAGMYNNGASPIITQCTFIRNLASDDGGGLCNYNTTANITNCSFIGNKAGNEMGDMGGGMYNHYGWPQVTNCTFTGNTAGVWGGGMQNDNSSPTVVNCRFSENAAGKCGGGIFNDNCAAQIFNCSFWKNWAWLGGGAGNSSSNAQFTNCTMSGNTGYASAGGIYSYYFPPNLTNCILWGNSNGQVGTYNTSTSITYSIVQGGWSGTGNLSTNPLFVNTTGDLHLQDGSPAINAGNNAAIPTTLTTDLDGRPRILYGRVDMGAYEYSLYKGIIYVKKDATGTNNGTSWINAFTSLQDALALAAPNLDLNQVWVAAGTYYPDEGSGLTDNDRTTSFVLKKGVTIYGGFVGTETTLGQRDVQAHTSILSGDIDGDGTPSGNAYHVVRATGVDHTAVLNDVTITGGNANGPAEEDSQGGGLYISSSTPWIHYCTFSGNAATEGGAVYTTASFPSFGWCRFTANTATTGGALYNGGLSQTTLLDVHFTGNTATNGGAIYNGQNTALHLTNGRFFQNTATGPAEGLYKGGAIYNASAYNYLLHGSFSANTATAGYGGALYNENSSPFITNSVLWGNSTEIDNDATSTPTVTYSLVKGGYPAGTNILDQDPLFRDAAGGDLHLNFRSPAIDTGNNEEDTYVYTDLDGNPRIHNNRADMGAYEYTPAEGSPKPLTLTCPQDFTLPSDTTSCGTVVEFIGEHAATTSGGKWPVTVTYSPASSSLLPVGENTVTVTATDSDGETRTCSFTVTVVDVTPPLITCPAVATAFALEGQPLIKATDPGACSYTIKGAELDVQASDNCSTPLIYSYFLSGATTTAEPVMSNTLSGMVLNQGMTTITWVVWDAAGNPAFCHFDVLVSDKTPPEITSVVATPSVLYPPNHQLQEVKVKYTATDNCEVAATTLSVSSNEETNTIDDHTSNDWQVLNDSTVRLRAERSGKGTNRVYTLTLTAKDAAGNESQATATVTVPHDMRAPVTMNEAAAGREVSSLEVRAVPNPSANGFTLMMQSPSTLPLSIKVMDAAGRVIEQKDRIAANGTLYIGSTYRPGVYYLQVVQGEVLQTVKLVKR